MNSKTPNGFDRNISDDDLVQLYYGEHDDPDLAARVAASDELSARFEALGQSLKALDDWQAPEKGDDYGAEIWERISPRLHAETTGKEKSGAGWRNWFAGLATPRLSLAGLASLAVVAVLAFSLGRMDQSGSRDGTGMAQIPAGPAPAPTGMAEAWSGPIPQRVLTRNISAHLDQVNRAFTQFVSLADPSEDTADWATDLLVSNRLYQQAASQQGESRLAGFLSELEPLLIELAYKAHQQSPTASERMQNEISDKLLFRVRFLNRQLEKQTIST